MVQNRRWDGWGWFKGPKQERKAKEQEQLTSKGQTWLSLIIMIKKRKIKKNYFCHINACFNQNKKKIFLETISRIIVNPCKTCILLWAANF